jgi:hypothetical protein
LFGRLNNKKRSKNNNLFGRLNKKRNKNNKSPKPSFIPLCKLLIPLESINFSFIYQHISFRNYQCSIVMNSIGFLILNMKFFLFYSDFILDTRMLPFIIIIICLGDLINNKKRSKNNKSLKLCLGDLIIRNGAKTIICLGDLIRNINVDNF